MATKHHISRIIVTDRFRKCNAIACAIQGRPELGGACVLMGVGLNQLTFLHYAEQVAGRNTFHRWANGPDGKPMMLEFGGCSDGFPNLRPALDPILRTVTVGSSQWLVGNARDTLTVAVAEIGRDPIITHCGSRACERCRDAVLGGPILDSGSV